MYVSTQMESMCEHIVKVIFETSFHVFPAVRTHPYYIHPPNQMIKFTPRVSTYDYMGALHNLCSYDICNYTLLWRMDYSLGCSFYIIHINYGLTFCVRISTQIHPLDSQTRNGQWIFQIRRCSPNKTREIALWK